LAKADDRRPLPQVSIQWTFHSNTRLVERLSEKRRITCYHAPILP
jgi:hypothetical protein